MKKNEPYIEEANEILRELASTIKSVDSKIPSKSTIFKVLSTISYDKSFVGKKIDTLRNEIIRLSMESTLTVAAERNLLSNGAYTTYRVKYPEIREITYNDLIWLHFSLTEDGAVMAFSEVQKILASRKISYQLKVAKYLGPDLIVLGLYTKEDVKRILDICADNPRVQEAIMHNNPFMPHENGIGVVKEIEGKSYTHQVSDLLYNYTKNILSKTENSSGINSNWFSFPDFISYVSEEFNRSKESESVFDRYLNYQVLLGLNCIYTDNSYLSYVEHLKPLEYNKDAYSKYKMSYENRELMYIDQDDNLINESSNYPLWLKLQAHSCLERMYFETHNEVPKDNESISANLSGYLSSIANCIMAGKPYYGMVGYNDEMIKHLLPYLVAYNAYMNKMTNIEETKFIVLEFARKIVFKTRVDKDNKDFYTVDKKIIPSTIPPIRINGKLIGIEYLDYENNYCNITILENGEIQNLLGVFMDADKEKLWGEKLPGASLYRAVLGQALSKGDVQTEKIERSGRVGELLKIEDRMKQLANIPIESDVKRY